MSLEDKIEELTEAVIGLTNAMEGAKSEPEKPKARTKRKPRTRKEPESVEPESEVDLAELRKKFRELTKVAGREGVIEVLAEFGAKKVPEIKEEDYADVAEAIDAAIDEASND